MLQIPYSFKKRFFTLDSESLSYFHHEDDENPLGVLHLTTDTTVVDVEGDALKFDIITPGRTLHMKAESSDNKQEWSQAIQAITLELGNAEHDSHSDSDHEEGIKATLENENRFSDIDTIIEGYLVKRAVQGGQKRGAKPVGPPPPKVPHKNSLLSLSFGLGKKKKKGMALMPTGTATEDKKIEQVSKK